jgi:hypothetical protein
VPDGASPTAAPPTPTSWSSSPPGTYVRACVILRRRSDHLLSLTIAVAQEPGGDLKYFLDKVIAKLPVLERLVLRSGLILKATLLMNGRRDGLQNAGQVREDHQGSDAVAPLGQRLLLALCLSRANKFAEENDD